LIRGIYIEKDDKWFDANLPKKDILLLLGSDNNEFQTIRIYSIWNINRCTKPNPI
jgi:hypothetical protein